MQYTVDRQNYKIFKTGTNAEAPFVHFFWGKFDFCLSFETDAGSTLQRPHNSYCFQGKHYFAARLELIHHHQWYRYVKPTAHGLVLEETLWEHDGKKHHVELPRDFFSVCQRFCANELGFKHLASHAA